MECVQEVILAPAVGIAALDIPHRNDVFLFFPSEARNALAIKEALPGCVVGIVSFLQGFLLVFFGCILIRLDGLDRIFIGGLGFLQVRITLGGSCVRIGGCVVIVQGMFRSSCQLVALPCKSIQAFLLSGFCCFSLAVIGVCRVDNAHILPELELVAAAGECTAAGGVFKAAGGGEINIAVMADDGADAHVAIGVFEGNVAGCVSVETGRKGIGAEGLGGRVGRGIDGARAADQVDAFPCKGRAAGRGQVAVSLELQVACCCAGLDAEISFIRKDGDVAAGALHRQGGICAEGTVVQVDIAGCAGCERIREDAGAAISRNAAGIAIQGNRATGAGRGNIPGQVEVLIGRNGNGILAAGNEAGLDRVIGFDGIGTAGGAVL